MNTRVDKRKGKRRKKILGFTILTLLFLVLITGGYVYLQYQQGLKSAGPTTLPDNEEIEFNGQENELGKINVLLLGVDSRGEKQSRTDTIMIAQYDPKNDSAKVVSIMRDIYAEIPEHENYKINTAYFLGGPELLRQTIKQNFGIDVQYYALLDFTGFQKAVDTLAPNGVEINVEKKMAKNIDVVLEPGLQRLNGKQLLGYARFRHDAEADFGRVRRQQEVISALKDEIISVNGITKLPKLMGTIQPYIETNMSGIDRLSFAKDFLLNPPDKIETLRIPVDGSYKDGYYRHAGSVLEIDFDKNRQALQDFLSNEPTGTAINTEQSE